MKKKHKYIAVDEDFAKALKIRASVEGKSMLTYTKELSIRLDDIGKEPKKKEEKKFGFRL